MAAPPSDWPVSGRRRAAAACAALLAASATGSPAVAAPDYPAGQYTFQVSAAYLVDVQGSIDNDSCAELYGNWAIRQGGMFLRYFHAIQKHPVSVCENNTPLSDGAQAADVPMNSDWGTAGHTLNLNGRADDPGWELSGELYDKDDTSGDDVVCKGESKTLRPSRNMVTAGTWTCTGEGKNKLVVEWKIRRTVEVPIAIGPMPVIGS